MSSGQLNCPHCGARLPEAGSACPYCEATLEFDARPSLSIPGYRIVRQLGAGGMGAVYLAEDETLRRQVAVKLMQQSLSRTPEARVRFLREARAMASVEHPNVVRVYSFGESADILYLVMEYVEGESLTSRIRREGRLPVDDVLRIVLQATDGLQAAWEHGIVHRDVKPSNILLDRHGQVRVADFGLAQAVRGEEEGTLTATGLVVGTPNYIPPEQARGQAVDHRSDIYSLGIVLYEMLAGEPPFPGSTPFEIVDKHLHEPLPLLASRRPEIPAQLSHLLVAMTAKEPRQRPASYEELRQAVVALQTSTPSTLIEGVRAPTSARTSRAGRLASIGILALLVALFLVIWRAYQPRTESQRAPARPAGQLLVAVAPFYGPDEDSAKEGRVMAALVERAVAAKLGPTGARVLGIDVTKEPVRDHEAARTLGETLGVDAVVWGEAFALRGETELRPSFTLIPPPRPAAELPSQGTRAAEPMAVEELAGSPALLSAEAPNQIELRRTSAEGIGDVVLFLAGVRALLVDHDPAKALRFFDQAPRSAQTLRFRSQALAASGSREEALTTVQEAIGLDPHDAGSLALLGDLRCERQEWRAAFEAYRSATATGAPFIASNGFALGDELLVPESVRSLRLTAGQQRRTVYLLARDPASGRVHRRYLLQGVAASFRPSGGSVAIAVTPGTARARPFTVVLGPNGLDRYSYPPDLLLRLTAPNAPLHLVANFVDSWYWRRAPPSSSQVLASFPDAPRSLPELEASLRAAIEDDPTQPWYEFLLGEVLAVGGRGPEAETRWERIFAGGYPATPYYEFARMARYFEDFGQQRSADRAFAEALRRRKAMPEPISVTSGTEQLVNFPPLVGAAYAARRGEGEAERRYVWVERAREISGVCPEAEGLAASAWSRYFRQRGDRTRAKYEAARASQLSRHPLSAVTSQVLADYLRLAALGTVVAALVSILLVFGHGVGVAVGVEAQAGLAHPVLGAFLARWECWPSPLRAVSIGVGIGGVLLGVLLALGDLIQSGGPFAYLLGITAGLVGMLWLASRARGVPVAAVVACVPRMTRWSILSALILVVPLIAATAHFEMRCWRLAWLPAGLADATGSVAFVQQLEEQLGQRPGPAGRYALAVCSHLAGETDRARKLYQSLPDDARAQENLSALERGSPVPIHFLGPEDLRDAVARPPLSPTALSSLAAAAVAIALLVAVFVAVPARDVRGTTPLVLGWRQRLTKLGYLALPGTWDLVRGPSWLGLVTLEAVSFLIVVGGWFMVGNSPLPFAPGPVSAGLAAEWCSFFPAPVMPPDVSPEMAAAYWVTPWSYPYVSLFCAAFAAAGVVVFAVHALRVRKILRLGQPVSEDV